MELAEMPPRSCSRALPWIITLAFHSAFAAVCAVIVVSVPGEIAREARIDLSFASSPGPVGVEGAGVESVPVRSARPDGQKVTAQPPVAANAPRGVERKEDSPPTASSAEVSSVPAGDTRGADAGRESSAGLQPGERIGWEGSARKLIHAPDPAFPAPLSAAGQEVECEARITVAASGVVTRVEITRSSGYIEIDASVEAALRDYLFSRANERKDTVGTIRFRFRLEKQD
jgi:TonB family protein